MGLSCSSRSSADGKRPGQKDPAVKPSAPPQRLPPGVGPSQYRERVGRLARAVLEAPPPVPLEETLRRCIAFCYGVTTEWAPHVRVTVFADNAAEHQTNVPVYDTLLLTWGEAGFEALDVPCRPIMGTDVMGGRVVTSCFWQRFVLVGGRKVTFRALGHQLLHWFTQLDDADPRKQLLVNMLLQLHEACFNCIGRHKEVFEYCVYDLIEAELEGAPGAPLELDSARDLDGARRAVCRHAAWFLDRHKRDALHGAILSPLKFLFQDVYEVYENLDSHGASFWAVVLAEALLPGLELPFESIVGLDKGWTWGSVDFVPMLERTCPDGKEALRRFAAVENLGRDWRSISRGLRTPGRVWRTALPGLPPPGARHFARAVSEAKRTNSSLRTALEPYAGRFAALLAPPVLLRRYVLLAASSARWDAELGPALSALSEQALGTKLPPDSLRERLCGDEVCGGGTDAAAMLAGIDLEAACALLGAAGVPWAVADDKRA